MSDSISQKRPRIRLASFLYSRLRMETLERDNWRCQVCGGLKNLDVHHIRRRSALGDDLKTNLDHALSEMPSIDALVRPNLEFLRLSERHFRSRGTS